MQIKIKKHGQASMEYIMTLGVVMLVFIMVLYVVYEKNMEIIKTKSYLDAQRVTNSIVTNINTISEQGDGYYKYFTIPGELYGGYDYEIIIQGNTVELRWGIFPYTYSKSPITANVHGFVVKDLNKVLNCGGEIYVGFPPISCEEALVNVPPIINIIFPGQGDTLNCSPIIINGNASDVNGTVMEVEVSIDGGLFWNADIANQSNETTWDYSWSPGSDGTHTIRARAIDEYGAYSDIETITVTVEKCSDLIPLGGTFIPSGSVKTGTIQAVSIDVRNDGVGSCGSFKVNIEIKDGGGVTVLNDNGTIAGLGAGGTGTVSATWNVSEDIDNYAVTVTVDSGSDVIESDETNNIFSTTVQSTTDPPTSIITFPGNGTVHDYDSVKDGLNITGTADDEDGSISKVKVRINAGSWNLAVGKENWTYPWYPPEANANYTICSRATDNNGYNQTEPYCIEVEIINCVVEEQLNVGRDGWKVYNSTNCTGPSGWTEMDYNDASWADITLPMACIPPPGRCEDCDFYFRKHIDIPTTIISAGYKFGSDDGMWLWINNDSVIHHGGACHGGGCAGSGCCDLADDPVLGEENWRDITTYFNEGDNIVAVHLSERGGYEFLDMIFNITYNKCDL